MNILKRALCLLLCAVIAFSGATVALAAEEKNTDFTYSLKYYTEKNDAYNADLMLDKVDELLKEWNIVETFRFKIGILPVTITIDLTSVDSICETIDTFGPLLDRGTALIKPVIGDLAYLELGTWQTGLKRGKQDITIMRELIELANANREIVSKVCDGTLDVGVFDSMLDLEKILGPDGVAGYVKKFIIGLVYDEEKQSAEFNKAYETYKNNMDAFIYGELLNKYAEKYLPGFTMNESSTVEDLICIAFGLVVDKYIVPVVEDINIDLASSEYEDLRKLSGIVNLNGASFDFSRVSLDPDKDFLLQVNDVIGVIFTQLVPGYKWISGSYDKISENIEGAFRYVGKQSGLIPEADRMNFEEITMAVISVILRNKKLDEGVSECETLEDMAKTALINAERELGIFVQYSSEDTYLHVLGDIAARWLYNNFSVTDNEGKTLREGMGYDIFEVANFAANYLLFDKQVAYVLKLDTTKSETIFRKADKLLDYFGETKAVGVTFDSEKFLFGKGSYKGLLESIFSLDIENIIEITAVPALKNAGNVSATEFVYKCVEYAVNNWAGKRMIPAYRANAFNNALSNENIAVLAKVLLETVNLRKEYIIKCGGFAAGLLLKGEDIMLGKVSVRINDTAYTGERVNPTAYVTLGGKKLTQGEDFTVVTDAVNVGKNTAFIKGIGLYKGESEEVSFTVTPEKVKNLKGETLSESSVSLSWSAVDGADSYSVYICEGSDWRKLCDVKNNKYTAINLSAGVSYKFKVCVNAAGLTGPESDEITLMTKPSKVSGLEVKEKTSTSVSLSWNKVRGATHYGVFREENGKWTKVATVKGKTSCKLKSLSPGKKYTFSVRAYNSQTGYGERSDSLKVTVNLKKVASLKSAKTSETYIKLTWSKVSGATHYVVYQYKNGQWVKLKTVTGTSYTVKGLKGGKEYKFRVRAYNSDKKVYGDYSPSVNLRTLVGKPTSIKATSKTTSSLKLSWKKVPNATGYVIYRSTDGKKWTKAATTKTNSVTVKSLKRNTSYRFKIKAYQTVSSKNIYGAWSAVYKTKTK